MRVTLVWEFATAFLVIRNLWYDNGGSNIVAIYIFSTIWESAVCVRSRLRCQCAKLSVFITVHYNKEKVKKKKKAPWCWQYINARFDFVSIFFFFLSAMSFDGYFTFGGVYRASEFVVTVVTVSSLECRVPKRSVVECSTLGHVTYSDKKLGLCLHWRALSHQLCVAPSCALESHRLPLYTRRSRGAIFLRIVSCYSIVPSM